MHQHQGERRHQAYHRPDAGVVLRGVLDAALITEDVLSCLEMAPFAQPIVHLALVVLRAFREVRVSSEDVGSLEQRIRRLVNATIAATHGVTADVAGSLASDLAELEKTFQEISDFLAWWKTQGKLTRTIKRREFSTRIEDLNKSIDESLQVFSVQREIEMTISLQKLVKLVTAMSEDKKAPPPYAPGPPPRIIPELPPPPFWFSGRETEMNFLVDAICEKHPVRICIRGPGGIGKSALALQAMHDPRVEEFFGASRVFVRLDSAVNAKDILGQIAFAFGIFQKDMTQDVLAMLREPKKRFLLTLDNFEDPWDSEHRTEVERFLTQLAALDTVALIVTVRGTELPMNTRWTRPYLPPLERLDLSAAQDILESIADCRNSEWDELLKEVDYVPLAVTLLAHLAQSGEDPVTLMRRWKEEHTGLLDRSSHPDRESSLAASIQLSLNSSRMLANPDAARLLSIISMLPDGVPEADLAWMFQKTALKVPSALSVLRRVALVYNDDQIPIPFIRVLAPIRAFMQTEKPADEELLGLTVRHYFAKAAMGRDVWARAIEILPLLSSQIGNIQAMLSLALQPPRHFRPYDHLRHPQFISAISGYGKFAEFSNLGDTQVLETAIQWMIRKRNVWGLKGPDLGYVAHWRKTLAAILRMRSQHDAALRHYSEALLLFREANQLSGQGSCLKGMGDIHSVMSDYEQALKLYEEAHAAYDQAVAGGVKPFAGLGSCLKGVADLCLQHQMLDKSLQNYMKASQMFAAARDPRGVGGCLSGMAEIHLRRNELEHACGCYAEGLAAFRAGGTLSGQGNCLKGLGDVHVQRSQSDVNMKSSELDAALGCYNDGLAAYKDAGSLSGQASCLNGVGDVFFERGDLDTALTHYKKALSLSTSSAGAVTSRQGSSLQRIGKVYMHKSELGAAQIRTAEALSIYTANRRVLGQAICLCQLGEVFLRQSDRAAAEHHFKQSLPLFHGHYEQHRALKGLEQIHEERNRSNGVNGVHCKRLHSLSGVPVLNWS